MNIRRHILRTERAVSVEQDAAKSLRILPGEMDWTSNWKSFDLLGTTHVLDHMNQKLNLRTKEAVQGQFMAFVNRGNSLGSSCSSMEGELLPQAMCLPSDFQDDIEGKFVQLLHATWRVFDYHPLTIDEGMVWLGPDMVNYFLVVAEAFALLEKKRDLPLSSESLWQHSLRTGCLAGFLAKEEHGDSQIIIQSCLAGFSHDIGLVILAVSLAPNRYFDVIARARRQSISLSTAELLRLGLSHEIVGAEFLERQKFPQAIVNAVSFHDSPFSSRESGFTPTIAVYAANILDGGGWPQDSDGVPSDLAMDYLAAQGFVDPWPKWQQLVVKLEIQEFPRA